MNKMQLYRGRAIEVLNETYYKIIEAYETLVNRNFTEIPSLFLTQLSQVVTALNNTQTFMDIYYYITASSEANYALGEAQLLLEIAQTSVVIPGFNILPTTVILICFTATSTLLFNLHRRKDNGKTI